MRVIAPLFLVRVVLAGWVVAWFAWVLLCPCWVRMCVSGGAFLFWLRVVVFVCAVWGGCSCVLLCLFVLVCVPSRLVGVGLCWLCCLVFVCVGSLSCFAAWLFFENVDFSLVWCGFLVFCLFLLAAR